MLEFSTLDEWLGGAAEDHPLRGPTMVGIHSSLDYLLREIEDADILRWRDKRKRFRQLKKWSEFREFRAEVVVAALLVRHGIKVEFADDHPDLVIEDRIGIEIGCRTLDGPQDLANAVRDAIDPTERTVGLWFGGRPLRIAPTQIDDVVAIATAGTPVEVDELSGENMGYVAELDLTVAVMTPQAAWWGEDGGVEVQYASRQGPELAPLAADLEVQILNKMREKERQADSMPTILLLDFSSVALAWLRSSGVWTGSLEKLLKRDEGKPYQGLALMIGSVNELSPRTMALAMKATLANEELIARVRTALARASSPSIRTRLPPSVRSCLRTRVPSDRSPTAPISAPTTASVDACCGRCPMGSTWSRASLREALSRATGARRGDTYDRHSRASFDPHDSCVKHWGHDRHTLYELHNVSVKSTTSGRTVRRDG